MIGSSVFSQDDKLKFIKVFGWSRDGKVAVLDNNGLAAYILNTWDDKVLWGKSYFREIVDGKVPSDRPLNDLRQACRQYGIAITETYPSAPSGSSFQYNGQKYTITVNSTSSRDTYPKNYSVIAEKGGKKKTIFSGQSWGYLPDFVGYSVSPFGERALIIIYASEPSGEKIFDGSFVFIGCHLITGF